jgi:hypothetical protein
VARIRLDSRKSVRPFKEIICGDISEFESYMPSHAVRPLCAMSAEALQRPRGGTSAAIEGAIPPPHRPCWERMGAWLVGETAGRPFPLPVLGRLSRAQSRMAAPSPFRREPSSIFRRLSEPSHFVPSCRGTAAASSTESGAGEPRIRAGALPFVGLRSLAVAT